MFASITDQCSREIIIESKPQRIVSVVPSQTELLYNLGLEDQLVGITRFCVHPAQALTEKLAVGGTKKIVNSRLEKLQPDLIICNKEENTAAMVEFCESLAPTYVSDISCLEDALKMIRDIGTLTGTSEAATSLVAKIDLQFNKLQLPTTTTRALYLIWKNPFMSIGHDTFIHDMMQKAGFANVLDSQTRYPELTIDQILELNPAVVLFSSEPYNFKAADMEVLKSAFAKANKTPPNCILVDGELFSWYGSRLLKSCTYFQQLQASILQPKQA